MLKQLGSRFGLAEVEGKQKVRGHRTGTEWEIDAKGVRDGDGAVIVVECRRCKRSLTQEALGGVAYRIIDTGAASGITVSPLPLQKGAARVAAAGSIEHVQLRSDSSPDEWVAQIGDVIHVGLSDTMSVKATDSFEITVTDRDGNVIDRRSG